MLQKWLQKLRPKGQPGTDPADYFKPAAPVHQGQPETGAADYFRPAAPVNQFALSLMAEISRRRPDQNVFLSPAGIASALLLARCGASGETRNGMDLALALKGLSEEQINSVSEVLRKTFAFNYRELQLKMANAIWAKSGRRLNPDFVEAGRARFDAEVRSVDFSDPQTLTLINDWVSNQTDGKISRIVESLAGASLVLTNAVYFLGGWEEKFPKERTEERPFRLLNGQTRMHPLMFRSDRFSYYEDRQCQAAELPYVAGARMLVFLPAENSGLGEFCRSLNYGHWEKWVAGLRGRDGTVGLPRFRLEYEASLNQLLSSLGMDRAFDADQAEFDLIYSSGDPLYISQVNHKSFIRVDEEGTEAAAATAVMAVTGALFPRPEKPFTMIVDRPFFFVIREEWTKMILFAGFVVEP